MQNSISKNWKKLLGNDLLRFQPEKIKVLIKRENRFIFIRNDIGRFVELVRISYIKLSGEHTSFKAFIDSETGIPFDTFAKTISENRKPIKFSQHRN